MRVVWNRSLAVAALGEAYVHHWTYSDWNDDTDDDNLFSLFQLSITPSLYTLDREVMQYIKRRESAVYDFYPGTERTDYDYVSERTDMYTTKYFMFLYSAFLFLFFFSELATSSVISQVQFTCKGKNTKTLFYNLRTQQKRISQIGAAVLKYMKHLHKIGN